MWPNGVSLSDLEGWVHNKPNKYKLLLAVLCVITTACSTHPQQEPAKIINRSTAVDTIGITSPLPFGDLSSIAARLAITNRGDYIVPDSNETRCNLFVSDFVTRYFASDLPSEFSGTANNIFDNLNASPRWESYLAEKYSLDRAQHAANNGNLAIIAYKNTVDQGHVAIVVPSRNAGGAMEYSGNWGMKVPFIAQAGRDIFEYKKMSWGFASNKRSGMKVFIYSGAPT